MSQPLHPESPDPPAAPEEASQGPAPAGGAGHGGAAGGLTPLGAARARGRRIAFIVYFTVAGAVAAAGASQVFVQAFQRREAPEANIRSCGEGLARLSAAIERAREAGSSTDGEDAALADFRRALRPEWDDRDHVEDLCRASPPSMAALDAIEQLRYAEEHAVRREAAELAPLRRRVQAIAPRDPGPPAAATPSPSSAPPRTGGESDPRNP